MTALKDELANLITLTKFHIKQEYTADEWVLVDPASQQFFREYALNAKVEKPVENIKPTITTKTAMPAPTPKLIPTTVRQKNITRQKSQQKEEPKRVPTAFEIDLQKNTPQKAADFSDIEALMKKNFSNQTILKEIPDDSISKAKLAPEVIVVFKEEPGSERNFLTGFTRAIDRCICPTQMISADDKNLQGKITSASVKWIVGEEKLIAGLNVSAQKYTIKSISDYLQNPLQKSVLWEDIKKCLA